MTANRSRHNGSGNSFALFVEESQNAAEGFFRGSTEIMWVRTLLGGGVQLNPPHMGFLFFTCCCNLFQFLPRDSRCYWSQANWDLLNPPGGNTELTPSDFTTSLHSIFYNEVANCDVMWTTLVTSTFDSYPDGGGATVWLQNTSQSRKKSQVTADSLKWILVNCINYTNMTH